VAGLKVISYTRGEDERAGIVIDGTVYDVGSCVSFLGMSEMPTGVLGLLSAGKTEELRELHQRLSEARQDGPDLPLRCWASLEEITVLPPISRPRKIICVGRNYRDHADEQGAKLPKAPLLFAKAPTAVIGTGEPIVIPRGSEKVDYEGELALVIGHQVRGAGPKEAALAIFGYCCLNDVTERDAQSSEKQWFRSKSMDTFAPLGPWIVTRDELGDAPELGITTKLNSKVMQSSSTANLIFKPADVVAFAAKNITLEPGDIISTGTPGGVGVFRDPQVFLRSGDTVEVTIEGIGTLVNPVTAEG
jgi:2-keto-4-pentenoate hydratase/2-oxohepta-3-ene-1,7-dioic acid hydratase in catechol pathway